MSSCETLSIFLNFITFSKSCDFVRSVVIPGVSVKTDGSKSKTMHSPFPLTSSSSWGNLSSTLFCMVSGCHFLHMGLTDFLRTRAWYARVIMTPSWAAITKASVSARCLPLLSHKCVALKSLVGTLLFFINRP